MKRILQICNYFYPHIGGIEQVARDIAHAVSGTEKFEQQIICLNEDASDGTLTNYQRETIMETIDGIPVTRCGSVIKKASQSISLTFPKQLDRIMNKFDPDIVIFHYPNPYEAFFFERYFNKNFKLIIFWHLDITRQKLLKKLFHGQSLRLLKRADKIIATSPNYIEGSPYLSRFREKCVVIPCCINEGRLKITEKSQAIAKKIREENTGKIICFSIGRHVPYKGFTYLIQASKLLDDRFRFYIGGKGPLTEQLKAEAAGDKKITFLGRISDENLIAWYSAMDIFCFPSVTKNEAFGIALAEAMYFAKPAVTFTIPGSGVNYVCPDGETGIECPNADANAYAKALSRFADIPELRVKMGTAARQRVKDNFLDSHFKNQMLSLLA